MPEWPFENRFLDVDGATFKPYNNSMAIDPESGAPMTRRRFTGLMADYSGKITLETEDASALWDFWYDECDAGALPFDMPHPLWGDPINCIWMEPPTFNAVAPEVFEADVSVRFFFA